jgi:hypothetical protein
VNVDAEAKRKEKVVGSHPCEVTRRRTLVEREEEAEHT